MSEARPPSTTMATAEAEHVRLARKLPIGHVPHIAGSAQGACPSCRHAPYQGSRRSDRSCLMRAGPPRGRSARRGTVFRGVVLLFSLPFNSSKD